MTQKQVFRFAYGQLVRSLKVVADEIGRERLVEILLAASEPDASQEVEPNRQYRISSFSQYVAFHKKSREIEDGVVVAEFHEETEDSLDVRITECLWAKTFCEMDATDIGYAVICHGDFAAASRLNPRLKLIRTKTLMQGHECCNFRYVWHKEAPL
jgi:hypothetical protein